MATLSLEYQREWHRNHPGYHNRHHVSIISELGGVCKNCGETEKEFLTIDHVLDDGFMQRKQLRWNGVIYKQILSELQSGKYQILCFNCNIDKSIGTEHKFTEISDGRPCKRCFRPLSEEAFKLREEGRLLRWVCRDCESDQRKQVKQKVFESFGGHCICCAEVRLNCLSLDHIDEDGSLKRVIHKTGFNLYYRILNGSVSPDGLQLMCFNCNFSKHVGGQCVHRRP